MMHDAMRSQGYHMDDDKRRDPPDLAGHIARATASQPQRFVLTPEGTSPESEAYEWIASEAVVDVKP